MCFAGSTISIAPSAAKEFAPSADEFAANVILKSVETVWKEKSVISAEMMSAKTPKA